MLKYFRKINKPVILSEAKDPVDEVPKSKTIETVTASNE